MWAINYCIWIGCRLYIRWSRRRFIDFSSDEVGCGAESNSILFRYIHIGVCQGWRSNPPSSSSRAKSPGRPDKQDNTLTFLWRKRCRYTWVELSTHVIIDYAENTWSDSHLPALRRLMCSPRRLALVVKRQPGSDWSNPNVGLLQVSTGSLLHYHVKLAVSRRFSVVLIRLHHCCFWPRSFWILLRLIVGNITPISHSSHPSHQSLAAAFTVAVSSCITRSAAHAAWTSAPSLFFVCSRRCWNVLFVVVVSSTLRDDETESVIGVISY